MYSKFKLFSFCMIAAIFVIAASGSWASPDCTWSRQVGTGTYTTTLAVAANFVMAAKDLVTACQDGGYCNNTKFIICSDSTSNLATELKSEYSSHSPNAYVTYGYFFAADDSTADFEGDSGTSGADYLYANGIPVFFAKAGTLDDVSHLITHTPALSGSAYNITTSSLSGYTINTADSDYIAVAGTGAPYGVMAHTIINTMQGTSLPGTIPAYVRSPLYTNVGNVLTAVNNGTDTSGFGSKGQICDPSQADVDPDVWTYVAFTNSAYKLAQYAIRLNSSTAATALDTYIRTTLMGGSGWDTFIANHCYEYDP
ncbi:MAG: hypothetical protein A4E65_00885 [Syntrophorhabdus sp. PtaU1.Bin153]|nr:MAG: hypothetical protein A4E65_00885 [Syntrophorhabdus sp. PtaU1.Bin153]